MNAGLAPLERFERIVFFTGAGLSSESGIPTYRGSGGIWGSYDWQEYACQRAFDAHPERVWDFHDERRRRIAAVEPAPAHRIIAAVQQSKPNTRIVTQNIDGLHQRAGAHAVAELHGSIWRVRCACDGPPREDLRVPIPERRCATCGAWRRPDIVWFEDPMSPAPFEDAARALATCDLLVSIGTSAVVHPAAELPALAKRAGALLIEVNPEPTPVSSWYAVHLRQGASDALRTLWPEFADDDESSQSAAR